MSRKKHITKHCTIYTDASFDHVTKKGQAAYYAIWSNHDGPQIMEGVTELFPASDSLDAEFQGVHAALNALVKTNRNEFLICCDNMAVVNLLDHKKGIIRRNVKMKYDVITKIKAMVEEHNYTISTKHVKGHDNNNMSKAARLNRKVDKLSRSYKNKE